MLTISDNIPQFYVNIRKMFPLTFVKTGSKLMLPFCNTAYTLDNHEKMTDDNQQFIETFKEEALELLGHLEDDLLELEANPGNPELLSAVFRVMHTIKGSAAMFGLDGISRFAHEVESVLSALRDGTIPLTKKLIGNVLIARDIIDEMIAETSGESGSSDRDLAAFISEMKADCGLTGPSQAAPHTPASEPVPAPSRPDADSPKKTWRIDFKPSPQVYARCINPFNLLTELMALGESVCVPEFAGVPPIETIDQAANAEGWTVFLTTAEDENRIKDVFIFVEGDCELAVSCLSERAEAESGEAKRLGEILVEKGRITNEELSKVLSSRKLLGEALVEEGLVSPVEVKAALEEQRLLQKIQTEKKTQSDLGSIRVKSERLDELMALVGELVTVHARVSETSKSAERTGELETVVEQLGRLTESLRNLAMNVRMVPVGPTFSSFKRLVRDLSGELGKSIELESSGGETELDKSVIDRLHDPLVHIVRNSVDHGIETPDVRASRGKPETGTIKLHASQAGAAVLITVEDDGNGLDRTAIREKALSKGLIQPTDKLTDEEIFRLIFLPGFSTKKAVSAVSGRGVGMDVVNRQMEAIGGKISIESPEGRGTKMTLSIPLTLAIIDGLMVSSGDEYYVIPLSCVTGCAEYREGMRLPQGNIVAWQGKQLPFVDLRDFFGIAGERPKIEQIVVATLHDQTVGLLVDRIHGSNQTVIKPLDAIYRKAKGVSSATIRGNGSIALIIDVEQIIQECESQGGK